MAVSAEAASVAPTTTKSRGAKARPRFPGADAQEAVDMGSTTTAFSQVEFASCQKTAGAREPRTSRVRLEVRWEGVACVVLVAPVPFSAPKGP